MKRLFYCAIALFVFALILNSRFYILDSKVSAVPPTAVKDVLSSSQLSYFGQIGASNTAGNTNIKIQLSGNPSNTTNNLFIGDTIAIGDTNASTLTTYVVSGIGDTANFSVSSAISDDNNDEGLAIIATRSAIHTIHITPQSNITGGAWQFLIKASSNANENESDGIPDQYGFDLGSDIGSTTTGLGTALKAADVSCPWGATASVGTTTIVSSNSYHVIKCDLGVGETSPVGIGVTVTIGRDLSTGSQLINPAPAPSRTEGNADTYTFFVQHLKEDDSIETLDTLQGIIAVVESVRVTADIDPTLTFIIDAIGVGAGSTACGNTSPAFASNADNTTAVSASFGSVSLGAFNNLAHRLSAVTNASGGYSVTVYQSSPMANATGTTLPDTDCDGACDYQSTGPWITDTTDSGWGYTIQSLNIGETIFDWNSGYRAFAPSTTLAQEIMKNSVTPTSTERGYICYRLVAGTAQTAGSYESKLVYTATATF